jgi:hypothetical protein
MVQLKVEHIWENQKKTNTNMTETLNIDYHRCRLILKSLNTSKTMKEASLKCGISVRTMRLWCFNYNIIKTKDKKYERKAITWNISEQ